MYPPLGDDEKWQDSFKRALAHIEFPDTICYNDRDYAIYQRLKQFSANIDELNELHDTKQLNSCDPIDNLLNKLYEEMKHETNQLHILFEMINRVNNVRKMESSLFKLLYYEKALKFYKEMNQNKMELIKTNMEQAKLRVRQLEKDRINNVTGDTSKCVICGELLTQNVIVVVSV